MKLFKKILCLITLTNFLLLFSCASSEKDKNDEQKIEHNYSEIIDYKIAWKDAFSIAKTTYFIYIYQETCYYCNQFKNEIIEFRLKKNLPIFFIEYCDEICIKDHIEFDKEVCILGTPSLLEVYEYKTIDIFTGPSQIRDRLNFNS